MRTGSMTLRGLVASTWVAVFLAACGSGNRTDGEAKHSLSQPLAPGAGEAWLPAKSGPANRYIVMLHGGSNARAVAAGAGVSPTSVFSHAINGFAADLPAGAVSALGNNPNVVSVTAVRSVEAFAQQVSTGLPRIGGSANGATPNVNADVAVIDTGVMDSPDLNVVDRVDCVTQSSCVAGGFDVFGHGSHVSGIIGGIDNDLGVAGVAPGARLHSVKVLGDDGYGTTESVVRGLDYVAAHASEIDVANMSLGGLCGVVRGPFIHLSPCDDQPCSQTTDPEHTAVCSVVDAGVTLVVAAGNDDIDAKYATPAAYDEVITVSALADFDGAPGGLGSATFSFSSCTESEDDSFACFSNFGADVDLMAPGVGILSTTPTGLQSWSGTSMAAPHVTGAAALVKAQNHSAPPADVLDALLTNAESNPCASTQSGGACADDGDSISEPLVNVTACSSDADCDDDNACNGNETCNAGTCVSGTPVNCDDADACTNDTCNAGTGACSHTAVSCDDGNVCTDDICNSTSGCGHVDNSNSCDDGDSCTDGDVCSGGQCQPGAPICEPPPPSSCADSGSTCSSNSDCCSNKCRNGTCRG